jgi:hypothetical protein
MLVLGAYARGTSTIEYSWRRTWLERLKMGSVNSAKKENYSKKTRIDVNEPLQLAYWTQRFGIENQELIAAILTVGPSAKAVENYLKGKKDRGQ